MFKIRCGDIVSVIAGKDKGKTGKVLRVLPTQNRCLVERINLIKKHMRRSRQEQQPGIIEKENPIHISNLMLFCNKCHRPTRVGFSVLQDGSKVRVCKKCKEVI